MSSDVNLDECAREPIHIPGGIQPHGALLACDDDLTILQASGNLVDHTGLDAAQVRGRNFGDFLEPLSVQAIARARDEAPLGHPRGLELELNGRLLHALVHRHHAATIVEIEPRCQSELTAAQVDEMLARIQSAQSLPELLRTVAGEMRTLTGFERVLVYQFGNDDSGHVVAESRLEELEPYLDLHYPAADIPVQARRLYLLNPLRLIPDAKRGAVPLDSTCRPDTGAPLDLTYAGLRAVSPVHLEYMSNMGVRASMSISIVVGRRLWGLINCGHRTPRLPSHALRSTCELIGRVTSLQIAAMEQLALAGARAERLVQTRELVDGARGAAEVMLGLVRQPERLLSLCDASGVAICSGGQWHCFGDVPAAASLAVINGWLDERPAADIVCTDSLVREIPEAHPFADVASGLLALSMPEPIKDRVLWFRSEVIHTVKWGGDPNKPADVASGRLRPRKSFELWKETVRATSLPWQTSVMEAARDLRRHCIELDLGLQIERARAAIRARDDIVAVVSHDLRNPIGVVQMAVGTIWRMTSDPSEPMLRMRRLVERIQRAIETMNALVHDLLDVSKIESGRFEVRPRAEKPRSLVEDAVDMIGPIASQKRIEISVEADESAPLVNADPERVFQVFSNLLGNAVKFAPEEGHIRVALSALRGEVEFTVRDDGPGIAEEQLPRLFDRYWQAREHRSGTGLGLYIAKGIVEAHRGRIWAQSVVGAGTTVHFTLPTA